MVLIRSFFNRPTLTVARELLGCFVVSKIKGKEVRARIVETEAYVGPEDKASHASRGRTKRTELMFGPAGRLYVYLIYGMWWCMNVVTEADGYPAAVLIRGIEINGERMVGPGRVCRALGITGKMNGRDVTKKEGVWFERGDAREKIKTAPRVGVAYAGSWAKKPWRFTLLEKR